MTKRQTTKSKIIEAAWGLFREKGYDETTIEDIIAQSGTSKGTFYHYFNGKDALLGSLSDIFDSYYEELVERLVPEMNSVDKLIFLSCEAHKMIGERIQPDLLASLYSSQVVTRGDKHLLNQNRFYHQLVHQLRNLKFFPFGQYNQLLRYILQYPKRVACQYGRNRSSKNDDQTLRIPEIPEF